MKTMYEIRPGVSIRWPDVIEVQEVSNAQVLVKVFVDRWVWDLGPFDTPLNWAQVFPVVEIPI